MKSGYEAEARFIQAARQHGYSVIKANRNQDMFQHIDFFISKGGKNYAVDVKAEKKFNRRNKNTDNSEVWIELRNVRGNRGWLFGDADFIAFEHAGHFLLSDRKKLIEIVNQLVDFKKTTDHSHSALYKIYSRAGRSDRITRIKTSDIEYSLVQIL